MDFEHQVSGELVTEPAGINLVFSEHYARLYTSECSSNNTVNLDLLNSLEYPTIDENIAKNLGDPVTELEIQEAIKSMKSGKSPGPDGFTVEFYKAFASLLAPILVNLYNDSLKVGFLPPTLSDASISLLLKKDKDPTSCDSYRTISLLNVDFKILTKVLCSRLERVLPSLILLDQTGFTPGRHSFFNTRRLLNILFSRPSDLPEIIVSLDAEKSFDRVEWGYLFLFWESLGLTLTYLLDPTSLFLSYGVCIY